MIHQTIPIASATTTSPAPNSNGSPITAEDVGAAFAFQYFKIMKTRPDDLFRFYNTDSRISRGSHGASGRMDVRRAAGQARIRELLHKEHSQATPLALAIIDSIDSQDSAGGAVIVQIMGTLRYVDETTTPFQMTVFLVQQDNVSLAGYYVLNDMLTFQATQPAPTVSDMPENVKTPIFPQAGRMTQEGPDPVLAPTAASGQPAAAPLPTTTAPQLSGNSTAPTPTAATSVSTEAVATFAPSISPVVTAQASPVIESVPEPVAEVPVEVEANNNPTVQEAGAVEPPTVEPPAVEEPAAAKKAEKKNPWKTRAPVRAAENAFDIVKKPTRPDNQAVAAPTYHSADPSSYAEESYAAHLLKTNVARAPCQIGFAVPPVVTNSKPASRERRQVSNNERRSPNRKGSGEIRNGRPTQAAAPAHNSRPNTRPVRAGRGKTLWVSMLPAADSDEKIQTDVAEQLRAQSCEGSVIRVERIPGYNHGYIELSSEAAAKSLIEKGLRLQGRDITVDFPSKPNGRRQPRQNAAPSAGPSVATPAPAASSAATPADDEEGWTSASRKKPSKKVVPSAGVRGGQDNRKTGGGNNGSSNPRAPAGKRPAGRPSTPN